MLTQVFDILAPLFAISLLGYGYGRWVRPDMAITNRLIMDVFMPALILQVMLREGFQLIDHAMLMVVGLGIMLMSGIAAYGVARLLGYEWRAFAPPAIFSNWANLGLPLYVFALGSQALEGGVMLVVLGNILCFTLGIYIYSGVVKLKEVLQTPVLLAVVLGLLVSTFDVRVPAAVQTSLGLLGQVAIPLMLFSLGVRLTVVKLDDVTQGIVMAVLCPVVGIASALLLLSVLAVSPLERDILILFAALPPAVVNFIMAEQYQRAPEQVASMIMIGNLAAILTLPLVLALFIL